MGKTAMVDRLGRHFGLTEGVNEPCMVILKLRADVEYKKFKDAAAQLFVLEERQEGIFPRRSGKLEFETEALPRDEAQLGTRGA